VNRNLEDSPPIRFILASASPARLATLRAAGVEPEVIVSSIDESAYHECQVSAQVHCLAQAKARDVADGVAGDALVLGCDSLLEIEGVGYGKPLTVDRAVAHWRQVRGKLGELHTGHALVHICAGRVVGRATDVSVTTVEFADLTDQEIADYVATGEPLNVAGGFTIDGRGGWYVKTVEGDHHNVVGLSLPLVRQLLGELGFTVADLPQRDGSAVT
jgi:nucleoside triphosphate pyrophosphatase